MEIRCIVEYKGQRRAVFIPFDFSQYEILFYCCDVHDIEGKCMQNFKVFIKRMNIEAQNTSELVTDDVLLLGDRKRIKIGAFGDSGKREIRPNVDLFDVEEEDN